MNAVFIVRNHIILPVQLIVIEDDGILAFFIGHKMISKAEADKILSEAQFTGCDGDYCPLICDMPVLNKWGVDTNIWTLP